MQGKRCYGLGRPGRGSAPTLGVSSRMAMMHRSPPSAPRRRAATLALCGFAAGLGLATRAAGAYDAASIKALGAFALLSDTVDVTLADRPISDSRLTSGERRSLEVRNIGFDAIALRVLRELLPGIAPQSRLAMFQSRTPISVKDQREIAAGARGGELPAWIVQGIQTERLSHVLLFTRARSEVSLPTADGHGIGRGQVEGIGFYLDPLYQLRNADTGAMANGALGAYVLIDLTLMDVASGEVVRSETLREQVLLGSAENRVDNDPWSYLTPTEKVELLRAMLERELRRLLPLLLKP